MVTPGTTVILGFRCFKPKFQTYKSAKSGWIKESTQTGNKTKVRFRSKLKYEQWQETRSNM